MTTPAASLQECRAVSYSEAERASGTKEADTLARRPLPPKDT